jgi:hypothetical protein
MEVGLGRLRAASVEYRGRLGKGISGSVSGLATAARAGSSSLDQKQGTDRQTDRQTVKAGRLGWLV